MGFYSNHLELANNYNALLFNPALLILSFLYFKNNSRWITNGIIQFTLFSRVPTIDK
jgi:hypothetical protein